VGDEGLRGRWRGSDALDAPNKDVLVGVQAVGDDVEQLLRLGLERQALCGRGRRGAVASKFASRCRPGTDDAHANQQRAAKQRSIASTGNPGLIAPGRRAVEVRRDYVAVFCPRAASLLSQRAWFPDGTFRRSGRSRRRRRGCCDRDARGGVAEGPLRKAPRRSDEHLRRASRGAQPASAAHQHAARSEVAIKGSM
jgi:hypothetical protein